MDYPFENLSPEKFQLFCQALIVREHKDVQCYPIGQPDGGRDALTWQYAALKNEFLLYQVKYVRNPQSESDLHKWLLGVVETEAPKVQKLIPRGAKQFILMTNVAGTAHLDVGSIDKLGAILTEQLGLPSLCLWRNDLSRRLDSAWDLKWAYPELMTGPDLIRTLIESGLKEEQQRRTFAIRSFIADQYSRDEEVRFKQVELQNKLLDLFIDVPVASRSGRQMIHDVGYYGLRDSVIGTPSDSNLSQDEVHYGRPRTIGAASFLLDATIQGHYPWIVLEGAPGQGKSTVTQYICQVHRMRLLGKSHDLAKISERHRGSPLRLPVRVDLRDYALWLAKQNPFSPGAEEITSTDWNKSLEAFLAALITNGSGGGRFDVSDLHAVLALSSASIFLDGLDEVADIKRRGEVVVELEKARGRLHANSLSLQIVVTSRPAAFANTPGLSEDKFRYVSLDSVSRELIDEYADKWLTARRVQERESAEVKKILKEKLTYPHFRDLARNQMQLAILLSLIHTRGASLPDKRTALYDNYIELFFNRESEKSLVVRDYRDLLINIHRYLGWLLHTEAEQSRANVNGRMNGAITSARLLSVLGEYLKLEGHNPSLAGELFSGVAERVMALVSRLEGTYEFEVQPLREYFAGRYLYETAPYSPTGNEKRGTKPDRFDAMAKDFYWLNVTRFYAGCYSKGELPSLIDRLNELLRDKDYRLLSHPRILAATLLGDWVFSQHPRSVAQVMNLILDDLGLRFVLVSNSRRLERTTPLVLPEGCGRNELVTHCFATLKKKLPRDYALDVIDLIRANTTPELLRSRWYMETKSASSTKRTDWFEYGLHLACLPLLTDGELDHLLSDRPLNARRAGILFRARKIEYLNAREQAFKVTIDSILQLKIRSYSSRLESNLELFAGLLAPHRFTMAFGTNEAAPLGTVWKHRLSHQEPESPAISSITRGSDWDYSHRCENVCKGIVSLAEMECRAWATTIKPWADLVEGLRSNFGESWVANILATAASGIKSSTETCSEAGDPFDNQVPLVYRSRFARLKAGAAAWWTEQLKLASTDHDIAFLILLWITWAGPKTIAQTLKNFDPAINSLATEQWEQMATGVSEVVPALMQWRSDKQLELPRDVTFGALSYRTASLLYTRVSDECATRLFEERLRNYSGNDLFVLQIAHKAAVLSLGREQKDWRQALKIISRAFVQGVLPDPYSAHHPGRHFISKVPLDSAKSILANAATYPAFIVSIAENRCRVETAARVRPVGKSAKEERWFSN